MGEGTEGGGEKERFCYYYFQSHNQTILCSYNADVLRAFKTGDSCEKKAVHNGKNIFYR